MADEEKADERIENAPIHRAEVEIDGNSYILTSPKSEEELRDLAAYVDSVIGEFQSTNLRFNKTMKATLSALNIAEDLFELDSSYHQLEKKYESQQQEMEEVQKKYEELLARFPGSKGELS